MVAAIECWENVTAIQPQYSYIHTCICHGAHTAKRAMSKLLFQSKCLEYLKKCPPTSRTPCSGKSTAAWRAVRRVLATVSRWRHSAARHGCMHADGRTHELIACVAARNTSRPYIDNVPHCAMLTPRSVTEVNRPPVRKFFLIHTEY